MIYLDTSAFIKLYFLEEGSDFVQQCIMAQDEPLPVWEIQETELVNACRLKAFWGDITSAQADLQIGLFEQRLRRGQLTLAGSDCNLQLCCGAGAAGPHRNI